MHFIASYKYWRATQTAPWVLVQVSLLQSRVQEATVDQLLEVNKLVRTINATASQSLRIWGYKDPMVVGYSDAAWAVRLDGKSQGGVLCFHYQPFF